LFLNRPASSFQSLNGPETPYIQYNAAIIGTFLQPQAYIFLRIIKEYIGLVLSPYLIIHDYVKVQKVSNPLTKIYPLLAHFSNTCLHKTNVERTVVLAKIKVYLQIKKKQEQVIFLCFFGS